MGELIVSKEDREFNTSIGNWQGDIEWNPGPVCRESGLCQINVPMATPGKKAQLSYPHVVIPRGKEIAFVILNVHAPLTNQGELFYLTITDGNYSYTSPLQIQAISCTPVWKGILYTTPNDWDKTKSQIIVTAYSYPANDMVLLFSEVSAYYTPTAKADHLPLMGVH